MSNLERYNKIFMEVLGVSGDALKNLQYQDLVVWDSVGHMRLVAALEDEFDIMMDTDDIIEFSSYEKGIEILSDNYEIVF